MKLNISVPSLFPKCVLYLWTTSAYLLFFDFMFFFLMIWIPLCVGVFSDLLFQLCRGREMKYLPCSLPLFRFLTWDSLEPQGRVIFIIWSPMRFEDWNIYFYLFKTLILSVWNLTLWRLSLQFVSPSRFSHIYSEKLVHLPHCYFVNDYKQVICNYLLICLLVLYAFFFSC